MKLQEALSKKVIGEEELAVISANIELVSVEDKIRLGFLPAEEELVVEPVKEQGYAKEEAPKKKKK